LPINGGLAFLLDEIVVNKDLTVQGQDASSTIVQSSENPPKFGQASIPGRVFTVSSNVTATFQDIEEI